MSKGLNAKKDSRKQPQKSLKEKKAAKKEKKNSKNRPGSLDPKFN